MGKYLVHLSVPFSAQIRGIVYDEALMLSSQGHDVSLLYCDGLMSQCYLNFSGNKLFCQICKSDIRKEKKKFGRNVKFISENSLISNDQVDEIKKKEFDWNSISQLKELSYNGVNIGLGVLSGYISHTRNLNPLVDGKFKEFINENLKNATLTSLAVETFVNCTNPDNIVLFNGRVADSRPVLEIASKFHIPFITLEGIKGIDKFFKRKNVNSTPHSIEANHQLVEYFWNDTSVSLAEKIRIGSSFFLRKKNQQRTNDKVFTKDQENGLLPENWNKAKKNIVIFNSSEDEIACVNDEFDKLSLFDSQMDGLKFIRDAVMNLDNIKVTLRIHPNLKDVQYSYATRLKFLESDNFDVIAGDAKVSSYALLDAADLVIVFGSTMGIESVFFGKPVILLGGAYYYYLDACYTPKSTEELLILLQESIVPKDRLEAIKFGYYILNEKWEYYSILNYELINKSFLHKKINVYSWQKTLGSTRLFFVLRYFSVFFAKKVGVFMSVFKKLPYKENLD